MDFALVRENLARTREEINRIQGVEGISGDVRIIAVTKGHPAEVIAAASAAGLEDIGENRVQEALDKRATASKVPVRWHLIGHLQTNKAKYVPGSFSTVHTIDSLKIVDALRRALRRASEAPVRVANPLRALLQVNVSGEPQKNGCTPDQVPELADRIAEMPEFTLDGLMTMAPLTDDDSIQRDVFSRLRQLRDSLTSDGLALQHLSMGMSADFRSAVAEGATMVRLGTVLFGERTR